MPEEPGEATGAVGVTARSEEARGERVGKIIGIDLGTTNSCVAVVEAFSPRVLANRDGSRTTPSIVAFTPDGDRLVGQIAKRQAITNPQQTVFAVKRLIGRKFSDPNVQRARDLLPYALVEAPNGDVKIQIRDRQHSPEEISAFILREIKAFAEEALGEPVREAIITVPAYFDDSQRQATKDAGRIAGLEVLRILNEPTAAALAYGLDRGTGRKQDRRLRPRAAAPSTSRSSSSRKGIFEVRSTAGDTYLGGEDFDQRIIDWLIEEFRGRDRHRPARRPHGAAAAEGGRRTRQVRALDGDRGDDQPAVHLGRRERPAPPLAHPHSRRSSRRWSRELVERTEGPCRDALEQAGTGAPTRSTRSCWSAARPARRWSAQTVERIFGRAPNRDINPDEVVAIGAAIQGGILRGDIKDLVLLDVTPLSLGIETHGGLFVRLIERNATIPTKNTQIFTTVVDNQDTVEIHVLQGEREIATENRSLGRFELVGIPPAPRGVPQIEVTFAIDSNGIVSVSARDVATNQSQTIQINPAGGLSKDEIERLVTEADQFAQADAQKRELRRLKNRIEGLIYTNEKVFSQFRDSAAREGPQAQLAKRCCGRAWRSPATRAPTSRRRSSTSTRSRARSPR